MSSTYLNEAAVRELLPPAKGAKTYFFRGAIIEGKALPRGFGVQVTANGVKSFTLVYRDSARRQRRETIGRWPGWTCVKAARRAHDLRQALDKGEAIGKAKADAERTQTGPTLADVLDSFVADHQHLRTIDEYERCFDGYVKPAIGERRAYTLQRTDMAKLRDGIKARAPVMASRVMSYLRSAFNWFQANDDRFVTPIVKGQVKDASKPRERVLSDAELDVLHDALDMSGDWPGCWPSYVRVLLLTASRRQEAASMRISDIELAPDGSQIWVLPGERYKTGQVHSVPLSAQAWRIIEREIGERRTGFVFSTDGGKTALGGFGKPMLSLRLLMGVEWLQRRKPGEIESFSLHDLRRTARTLLSRLKISPHIAELCLGHAVGGMRGVYDKWDYYDEKKEAFVALADAMDKITGW